MLNQILPTSPIKQWNLVLSSNSNKNKLTQFIVNEWKSLGNLLGSTTLYATHLQEVFRITKNTTEKIHELTSNHQEADTRILLHARHASLSYEEIVVSTPDTDVFLIMLSLISDMNIRLYMLTGTGSKRRIIDMNAVSDNVFDNQNQTNTSKNNLLKALIGFHCFTGCDTISSFAGRAKLKPLKLFLTHSDYVDAFHALGSEQHLDDDVLEQLERFTIHMYGKQPTPDVSLNDLRYILYCQKSGKSSLELLPPCFNVFQQHCKRANYQTYIWRQCFTQMMEIEEPTDDHGWCMDDDKLDIQWMTCSPAPDEVRIIKQYIHIYNS